MFFKDLVDIKFFLRFWRRVVIVVGVIVVFIVFIVVVFLFGKYVLDFLRDINSFCKLLIFYCVLFNWYFLFCVILEDFFGEIGVELRFWLNV